MKLATYQDGSRDGQLVVVSRDLSTAHYASSVATRLQQVIDDWNFLSPQLQELSQTLNHGKARHAFAFEPARCMAPLPRAFQWAEGAAYAHHVALLHKARGAEVPATLTNVPTLAQRASDDLLGPCADIVCVDEAHGADFGAGLAVITGDVTIGAGADDALEGIRLLMLANAVSLRQLIVADAAAGVGSVQGRGATAFGPVAVTPDELGASWSKGRVHLPLQSSWNGRKVGLCDAGPDMTFHFGQLIAHLCKTRNVRAGSIIGSGTVSNKGVTKGSGDKARTEWPNGYNCIAEKRAMETIQDGQPSTAFMQYGDTIRIEMKSADGLSIFGAIEQEVVAPATAQK